MGVKQSVDSPPSLKSTNFDEDPNFLQTVVDPYNDGFDRLKEEIFSHKIESTYTDLNRDRLPYEKLDYKKPKKITIEDINDYKRESAFYNKGASVREHYIKNFYQKGKGDWIQEEIYKIDNFYNVYNRKQTNSDEYNDNGIDVNIELILSTDQESIDKSMSYMAKRTLSFDKLDYKSINPKNTNRNRFIEKQRKIEQHSFEIKKKNKKNKEYEKDIDKNNKKNNKDDSNNDHNEKKRSRNNDKDEKLNIPISPMNIDIESKKKDKEDKNNKNNKNKLDWKEVFKVDENIEEKVDGFDIDFSKFNKEMSRIKKEMDDIEKEDNKYDKDRLDNEDNKNNEIEIGSNKDNDTESTRTEHSSKKNKEKRKIGMKRIPDSGVIKHKLPESLIEEVAHKIPNRKHNRDDSSSKDKNRDSNSTGTIDSKNSKNTKDSNNKDKESFLKEISLVSPVETIQEKIIEKAIKVDDKVSVMYISTDKMFLITGTKCGFIHIWSFLHPYPSSDSKRIVDSDLLERQKQKHRNRSVSLGVDQVEDSDDSSVEEFHSETRLRKLEVLGWNNFSNKPDVSFKAHESDIKSIQITPKTFSNGKLEYVLVTTSLDKKFKVWKLSKLNKNIENKNNNKDKNIKENGEQGNNNNYKDRLDNKDSNNSKNSEEKKEDKDKEEDNNVGIELIGWLEDKKAGPIDAVFVPNTSNQIIVTKSNGIIEKYGLAQLSKHNIKDTAKNNLDSISIVETNENWVIGSISTSCNYYAVGGVSGLINVYDVSNLKLLASFTCRNRKGLNKDGKEVTGIEWNKKDSFILVTTLDSRIRLLSFTSPKTPRYYRGHETYNSYGPNYNDDNSSKDSSSKDKNRDNKENNNDDDDNSRVSKKDNKDKYYNNKHYDKESENINKKVLEYVEKFKGHTNKKRKFKARFFGINEQCVICPSETGHIMVWIISDKHNNIDNSNNEGKDIDVRSIDTQSTHRDVVDVQKDEKIGNEIKNYDSFTFKIENKNLLDSINIFNALEWDKLLEIIKKSKENELRETDELGGCLGFRKKNKNENVNPICDLLMISSPNGSQLKYSVIDTRYFN